MFKIKKPVETILEEHEIEETNVPKVVINPGKAFYQRIKFVMRLKRRMKDFKTKKEKSLNKSE